LALEACIQNRAATRQRSPESNLKRSFSYANDRDEPAIITIETKPAGGVVKAFELPYGIANERGAAKDGLPKNPIARLVFIKTSQGYLPTIPRFIQQVIFAITAWIARLTGLDRKLL